MICWNASWRVALAPILLLFMVAAPARSDFTYDITVNTSSLVDSLGNPLTGSPGYLDLQFNPSGGTGTLSATVQALASNDTTVGSFFFPPQGNVTGSGLPLTFMADNTIGGQINDALLNVTFGTTLALSVDITPADANSTASFFLTLYDQFGSPISPNAGGNNFAIVELDLIANPSGSSPTVSPPLLGVGADAQPVVTAIPEPPSGVLLGTALACLAGYGLVRRKHLPVPA